MEFTVINFAIWFDLQFRILIFEVIAAIGFGFIFLSFLLPYPFISYSFPDDSNNVSAGVSLGESVV
ncbi:MAG: hypothetical protein A2Y71_01400 [Bacteroidetes bacterium RBG_13_42_15]|nr:MAG: hypothetical protein A2Y71_01400 [Bacteroidetes bacterium RBG_13_42_15]